MEKPTFVYTTYIRTTPERLWAGLTDPAFTSRYWGTTFETDWQPGSRLVWHHHGSTFDDPEQIVLAAEPYRRLSYTWHTFTPEWASTHGFDDDTFARVAAEPRSKVTFELEPTDGWVQLTVVHDGFEAGSYVAELVRGGWPRLVAELKTLLEQEPAVAV
jgi:uncharacterized protein YndB with AHSA1/START domain